jgi:hypothetical protein
MYCLFNEQIGINSADFFGFNRAYCELISFAQENQTNITTATNETGLMMGNQTNQTEGENQTQGPLEQLGETLGGIFSGGNQSQ